MPASSLRRRARWRRIDTGMHRSARDAVSQSRGVCSRAPALHLVPLRRSSVCARAHVHSTCSELRSMCHPKLERRRLLLSRRERTTRAARLRDPLFLGFLTEPKPPSHSINPNYDFRQDRPCIASEFVRRGDHARPTGTKSARTLAVGSALRARSFQMRFFLFFFSRARGRLRLARRAAGRATPRPGRVCPPVGRGRRVRDGPVQPRQPVHAAAHTHAHAAGAKPRPAFGQSRPRQRPFLTTAIYF